MLNVAGWTADQNQIIETVISEALFRCHVCLPCIVQSYNSQNNTVECQPTIRERTVDENGRISYIAYPLLVDVPVSFPSAGCNSITFSLSKGDEVLVMFSDLSIDNFWEKGSVQNPIEIRRHDLSDGIAIPCNLSKNKSQYSISSGITLTSKESDYVYTKLNLTAGNATIKFSWIEIDPVTHEPHVVVKTVNLRDL